MLTFKNAPLAITRNGQFVSADYSDRANKAIVKAITDGDIAKTGLAHVMEDDGSGNMIEIADQFEIADLLAFEAFLIVSDNNYVAKAAEQMNQSESTVWLKSDKDKYRVLTIADDLKITGKVLRYHVAMSGSAPVGVSVTIQTVTNKEIVVGTALISTSYIKGITKKEQTVGSLLTWADETIKDKFIVLNSRKAIKGETAYYREASRLVKSESEAFAKIADKSVIMKSDKGEYGFLHRVTNTSYTFVAIASTTEEAMFTSLLNSVSSIQVKVAEKEAMDIVDLKTLAEKNRIGTETIEHHINTAKRMLTNKVITQEQFDVRVANLLEKYGM